MFAFDSFLLVNQAHSHSENTPNTEKRTSSLRIQSSHSQAYIPKTRRTLSIMNMRRMPRRENRHISTPQLALLAILQERTALPFPLARYRRPHSRGSALLSTLHPLRDKRIPSEGTELRLWRHSVESRAADASWMDRQAMQATGTVALFDLECHVDVCCFGLRVCEERLIFILAIKVEVVETDAGLAVA